MPGINQAQEFDRSAIPSQARESVWHAKDGVPLRRIDWNSPDSPSQGSLLFLPGRGDCYEKYLETLDHWHQRGWRVTASDWRGQAGSGRLGLDDRTGHIDDFSTWTSDLGTLWQEWRKNTPAPHILIAHSMGGHLALRAVAERKVTPDALVLTAPMLGFITHGVPAALMHLASRFMLALGDPRRPAWKWSEKPGQLPANRITLLTHDEQRYADEIWWRKHRPELAMGSGSWQWVERAYASMRALDRPQVLKQISTPTLLLATSADRLVAYGPIRRAAHFMPSAKLITFGKEARHELLRECDSVRNHVLSEIDAFLDAATPSIG